MFFYLIFYLLLLALVGAPVVVCALIARGRGIPKTVHQPRLGWAAVGSYIVLCLIVLFLLIGNGDEDGDGVVIATWLAGFPWFMLSWPLLALRRASNLFSQNPLPSEWWDRLQGIAFAASFALNSFIMYQLGKRLPVLWIARPVPPPPPLLADLLSRAIVRRSLLVCGMAALIGFGWWYVSRAPSDDQLMATFHTNRPVFDQLVQMYIADDRDVLIDVDGSYRVRPAYPAPEGPGYPAPERLDANGKPFATPIIDAGPGYPAPAQPVAPEPLDGAAEARRIEYVTLLRRAGLTSIWPSTLNQGLYGGIGFTRDYAGPHRIVRLVVSTRKMFIYAQEPLSLANDQAVFPAPGSAPLAEGLLPGGGLTTRCRRIEDQWYLCTRLVYGD